MSIEHSEAVVLRGVDYSQTSRIVTFLAPHRGRLACIAKGVRRPRSGKAAALDTFNRLDIGFVWKESRAVQTLTECAVIDSFDALKTDLDRSARASIAIEIALRVAHDNEPSEALYAALVDGLGELSGVRGLADAIACRVVLRLLAAAGFAPSVEVCCVTGARVNGAAGFSLDGGVTVSREHMDRVLSAGDVVLLQRIAGSAPVVEGTDAAPLLKLLCMYAERQLDITLRSTRVLEQLTGRPERARSN